MADVRALLKAKRQEARISHPLASYSSTGQLRCSACGTIVKHASAWEGHLGSKNHRMTVLRLKEEEKARQEQKMAEEMEERSRGKRKAEEDSDSDDDEEPPKKPRVNGPTSDAFPSDFFSDPTRSIPTGYTDEDDEDVPMDPPPQPSPQPAASGSAIDQEWEQFQREVVNAPDDQETFASATVMAEPVLVDQAQGMPSSTDGPEQAPAPTAERVPLTEEEERQRKELEERELIMDRLLEEERAQEEADLKAAMMRNRIEAFKKARAARLKTES